LKRTGGATVDTLYVATDLGGGGTGISKFSSNDGINWTTRGTTAVGTNTNFFGLAARIDPLNSAQADIFLTTGNGSMGGNQIVEFIDTAAFNANIGGTNVGTIATAPAGVAFKGLDFAPQATPAPEPGTLLLGSFAALGIAGANYLRRRRAAAA